MNAQQLEDAAARLEEAFVPAVKRLRGRSSMEVVLDSLFKGEDDAGQFVVRFEVTVTRCARFFNGAVALGEYWVFMYFFSGRKYCLVYVVRSSSVDRQVIPACFYSDELVSWLRIRLINLMFPKRNSKTCVLNSLLVGLTSDPKLDPDPDPAPALVSKPHRAP